MTDRRLPPDWGGAQSGGRASATNPPDGPGSGGVGSGGPGTGGYGPTGGTSSYGPYGDSRPAGEPGPGSGTPHGSVMSGGSGTSGGGPTEAGSTEPRTADSSRPTIAMAETAAGPTPVDEIDELVDEAIEAEAASELAALTQERDEYRDALVRLQADFENYKKRMLKQQTEHLERAAEALVDKLLPVLDALDGALAHGGGEDVKQITGLFLSTLERDGLDRIDAPGVPFDPTVHEAVAHEPGDGGPQEVAEVLRAGYRWKGRLLRAAMVRVRG